MFYNIFTLLSRERGTTPTTVLKDLGLSTSKATAWKNGSTPNSETLAKIARYFDVTTDFLLFGSEEAKKTLSADQRELLENYALLDDIGKAEVRGYVKAKAEK